MIKSYLIINAYSRHNLGDYAIAIAIAKEIKMQYPDSKVVISADDYLSFENCPFIDKVIPTLAPFDGKRLKRLTKLIVNSFIFATYRHIGKSRLLSWGATRNMLLTEILRADRVISCGGGYLNLQSKMGVLGFLNKFLMIVFSRKFNDKTSLAAQSIGPFKSKIIEKIVVSNLTAINRIVIRDLHNFKELKHYSGLHIKHFPDAVFSLYRFVEPKDVNHTSNKGHLRIGITVRNWWFPGFPKDSLNKYLFEVSEYIRRILTTKLMVEIYLISQVELFNDNDLEVCKLIQQEIKCDTQLRIVSLRDKNLQEVLEFYRTLDLLVGTRMHSIIFSLLVHTPVIGIAYEPKTVGLMELFGFQKFLLPIESVSADNLEMYTEQILNSNLDYKRDLSQKIQTISEQSRDGLSYVIE